MMFVRQSRRLQAEINYHIAGRHNIMQHARTDPARDSEERRVLYEQILRCLDREGNLTHYRQLWGLQWNAACFAGFFVLQNTQSSSPFRAIAEVALAVLGSAAAILSYIGIRAAHEQVEFLIKSITERLGVRNHDWNATEFVRPYGDPDSAHRWGRRIATAFPLLVIVVWLIVFLYAWPTVFLVRQ
jgi:hypothetical protein